MGRERARELVELGVAEGIWMAAAGLPEGIELERLCVLDRCELG